MKLKRLNIIFWNYPLSCPALRDDFDFLLPLWGRVGKGSINAIMTVIINI
jgi:hypothetical protein